MAHLFNVEDETTKEENENYVLVQPLLTKYHELSQEPTTLPPHRTIEHKIPLKEDSKSINLRPYRFSYFHIIEIEKIVNELLLNGLIQYFSSPYSSAVLLVKMKDGSWRICVDLNKLNDDTIKTSF